MKTFLEILTLIGFFIVYKKFNLLTASIFFIFSTFITLLYVYIKSRKIDCVQLIGLCIMITFTGFTIYFDNPNFIKMKPTILYSILASAILFGLLRNKLFLRSMLNKILILEEKQWRSLSLMWIAFFFFLAFLNEFIWRLFPEETWVFSKAFLFPILSLIFIFSIIIFYRKNIIKS